MEPTQKRQAADGVETIAAAGRILPTHYNKPCHCPKFQTCNAPICPLDADWRKRSNHSEDATCYYLIESVKEAAETHFQVAGLGELYLQILSLRPDIIQRHSRIARKLEDAKQTGSRMARKVGGGV